MQENKRIFYAQTTNRTRSCQEATAKGKQYKIVDWKYFFMTGAGSNFDHPQIFVDYWETRGKWDDTIWT